MREFVLFVKNENIEGSAGHRDSVFMGESLRISQSDKRDHK